MKEIAKLLGVYLLIIMVLIFGCRKVDVPTPVINLGKVATATSIEKVEPVLTKGPVTLTLSVTKDAKYSIQLIDLKGDVKSSTGFTADKDLVIKNLDYSDVKSGDYTIVLLDISGNEYKRNLTIKK
jgi:hypothetical protein